MLTSSISSYKTFYQMLHLFNTFLCVCVPILEKYVCPFAQNSEAVISRATYNNRDQHMMRPRSDAARGERYLCAGVFRQGVCPCGV